MIRLQKVMAERGVASRRAAEDLISEGRVRVNGDLITVLGTRVSEDAHIEVDGRLIAAPAPHRYVLMNKPVGIVSTAHDERGRRTVVDHIGARERLYPVGRLDTDSEGLLLLTNDGTWAERVLHPRYGHEREYDVAVEGDLTDEALARLQRGIPLEEGLARAVRVSVRSRSRGRSRLSMVLLTGWRRQVRRMCIAVGLKVTRLVRVRMGPLELGKLRPGEFRDLTKREIDAMTAPSAKPAPRVQDATARPIVPSRGSVAMRPHIERQPVRSIAPRVARRVPLARARVGPVESARAGAPRRDAPRPGAPRVTRRAGSSRGPRAAAGPAARPARGPAPRVAPARPPQWRRSTRAARQRAAPRRAPR